MTTKEVLAILKKHLTEDSQKEASKTWDVLTALRGPDAEDTKLKQATTEVIRHKLLGDVGVFIRSPGGTRAHCGFYLSPDSEESAKFRADTGIYTHFLGHVSRAFTVLGLKWGVVNK